MGKPIWTSLRRADIGDHRQPKSHNLGHLTFPLEDGAELALLGGLRGWLEAGERTEEHGQVRISMTQAAVGAAFDYDTATGLTRIAHQAAGVRSFR